MWMVCSMKRLALTVLGVLGVLFFPWYLTWGVIIFGFIFFDRYWEGILLALLMDLIYSHVFWGNTFGFMMVVLSVVFYYCITLLKLRMLH